MKNLINVIQKKMVLVLGVVFAASVSYAQVTIYDQSYCASPGAQAQRCEKDCQESGANNCMPGCLQNEANNCAAFAKTVPSYQEFIANITRINDELAKSNKGSIDLKQSLETRVFKQLDELPEKVLSSAVVKDLQAKTKKQIQCEMENMRRTLRAEMASKPGAAAIVAKIVPCDYL